MYLNRIITMPITETTRCRVYKSSTSFMAKTFFNEDGTPKSAEIVDTIPHDISNTLTATSHLFHSEINNVYIIKYFNIDNNCLYYLIFNECDLKEVLNMISAKSVLYNKILEIKECEYFDCQLDNGLFIFDVFESPFRTDAQNKLGRFEDNSITTTSYIKNIDTGIIEDVNLHISQSNYFFKVGNFIFHKSIEDKVSIDKFFKTSRIQTFNKVNANKIRSLMSELNFKDDDFVEYLLNKDGKKMFIRYDNEHEIGFIRGDMITRIDKEVEINCLQLVHLNDSLIIDKRAFSESALVKIKHEIDELWRMYTHGTEIRYKLEDVIKRLELDDIFVLFNM